MMMDHKVSLMQFLLKRGKQICLSNNVLKDYSCRQNKAINNKNYYHNPFAQNHNASHALHNQGRFHSIIQKWMIGQ